MTDFERGVNAYKKEHSDPKVLEEIAGLKEVLKKDLVILGHHYQRNDVIRFADVTGDSLVLSRKAAEMNKKHIVFCGVYFMAECADILSADEQKVYIPDFRAGCAMADMARRSEVERVWDHLSSGTPETIIPVTYINSSADIKAFVGLHNGIICTSSNAPKVFDWAMERGSRILFLPDKYLGMNTALSKGIPESQMYVLDRLPDPEQIAGTKVFLWNGYCSVHKRFRAEDVRRMRAAYPGIRVIVHGECSPEVVELSDAFGSTSAIIRAVSDAADGSVWAVGTEQHLVRRLQERFPAKTVLPLSESGFQCTTMSMITPEKLLRVLTEIREGDESHRLRVENEIKNYAKIALMRMLAL